MSWDDTDAGYWEEYFSSGEPEESEEDYGEDYGEDYSAEASSEPPSEPPSINAAYEEFRRYHGPNPSLTEISLISVGYDANYWPLDPEEEYRLGIKFMLGQECPQNHVWAFSHFVDAARAGHTRAGICVARMYEQGLRFSQKDHKEAAKIYQEYAETGVATAQFLLGMLYSNGEGVAKNNVTAHVWFNLAASRTKSNTLRERAVKARDTTEQQLTPSQITEARDAADEWAPSKQAVDSRRLFETEDNKDFFNLEEDLTRRKQ